jgi:hypothetical protein
MDMFFVYGHGLDMKIDGKRQGEGKAMRGNAGAQPVGADLGICFFLYLNTGDL